MRLSGSARHAREGQISSRAPRGGGGVSCGSGSCDARLIRAPDGTHPRSPPHHPGCPLASAQHGERRAECRPACALPQLTPLPQLIFSAFKTLTGQTVTVELKNDVALTGELKSVDQFLNFRLDNIRIREGDEARWPHLVSCVWKVVTDASEEGPSAPPARRDQAQPELAQRLPLGAPLGQSNCCAGASRYYSRCAEGVSLLLQHRADAARAARKAPSSAVHSSLSAPSLC